MVPLTRRSAGRPALRRGRDRRRCLDSTRKQASQREVACSRNVPLLPPRGLPALPLVRSDKSPLTARRGIRRPVGCTDPNKAPSRRSGVPRNSSSDTSRARSKPRTSRTGPRDSGSGPDARDGRVDPDHATARSRPPHVPSRESGGTRYAATAWGWSRTSLLATGPILAPSGSVHEPTTSGEHRGKPLLRFVATWTTIDGREGMEMRRMLAAGAVLMLLALSGCTEPITVLTPSPGASVWTPPVRAASPEAASDPEATAAATGKPTGKTTPSPSARSTVRR